MKLIMQKPEEIQVGSWVCFIGQSRAIVCTKVTDGRILADYNGHLYSVPWDHYEGTLVYEDEYLIWALKTGIIPSPATNDAWVAGRESILKAKPESIPQAVALDILNGEEQAIQILADWANDQGLIDKELASQVEEHKAETRTLTALLRKCRDVILSAETTRSLFDELEGVLGPGKVGWPTQNFPAFPEFSAEFEEWWREHGPQTANTYLVAGLAWDASRPEQNRNRKAPERPEKTDSVP